MMLGDRLRLIRAVQGYSIRELAREAGVSRAALAQAERGGGLTSTTLLRVSEALGVSVDYLLRGYRWQGGGGPPPTLLELERRIGEALRELDRREAEQPGEEGQGGE